MDADDSTTVPVFDAPAGGELDAGMRAAFAQYGFLVLQNFVPVERCDALRAQAQKLVEAFDPETVRSSFSTTQNEQLDDSYFIESGDKIRFFFEADAYDDAGKLRQEKPNSLNKMGHAMHDLDPVFDAFSRTPELAEVARGVGFVDPLILQSMYIFKPPNIGGEVVCHQDSTYIYTEPESCVGFWFALEDATIKNGCLRFIPEAHKEPLRKRNFRNAEGELVIETLDDSPWTREPVAIEASAGTLVVFHGRTPHMSEANRSKKSRHAYTLHVIDRNCHYPAENWLQRDTNLPLRGFE